MTQEISANFHTLMDQASGTAATYMGEAVDAIDHLFGDGYAKKNPQLVGSFMRTAATDMGHAVLAQQIRAGLQSIADNMPSLDMDMESLTESLSGYSDHSMAGAICEIADAIRESHK